MPPGMPNAPAGAPPGWPGYAPYGAPAYGQPGPYYPQPYYYYPPPVNVLPPATLPYEEGEAVPMGYAVKTRPVRSMVIAGSVTFGATYLVSLLTASTVLAADSSSGEELAPLFAPIVGPFITIGTTKAEGAGTLWLVLDGLAQTAGAVMLIYGLVAEEKYLQRGPQSMGFIETLKRPEVFVGPRSAALRWQF